MYGYASSAAGDADDAKDGLSPMDERGPPSVYSSATEDEAEEDIGKAASVVGDVVQDVVDHATVNGDEEEEEEEEEEEDGDVSGEGDEGVTLKDRQDVSRRPVGM